jgi:hypothetical protein
MDAVIKNGGANFWDLQTRQILPRETSNYVPKILAAIKVASKAEVYGFGGDPAARAEGDVTFAGQ